MDSVDICVDGAFPRSSWPPMPTLPEQSFITKKQHVKKESGSTEQLLIEIKEKQDIKAKQEKKYGLYLLSRPYWYKCLSQKTKSWDKNQAYSEKRCLSVLYVLCGTQPAVVGAGFILRGEAPLFSTSRQASPSSVVLLVWANRNTTWWYLPLAYDISWFVWKHWANAHSATSDSFHSCGIWYFLICVVALS